MNYDPYLQGSYANHTNIRGNSDVDLVVESSSVFYSNLTEQEEHQFGIVEGSYGYRQFRSEVIKALRSYYGNHLVDADGQISVKVAGSAGRLAADVVPCITYKRYKGRRVAAKGITFWTKSDQQVVNYPKVHLQNGSKKNHRAANSYKPAIRLFKNARERIIEENPSLEGKYPSYFLSAFCTTYQISALVTVILTPSILWSKNCFPQMHIYPDSFARMNNSGSLDPLQLSGT